VDRHEKDVWHEKDDHEHKVHHGQAQPKAFRKPWRVGFMAGEFKVPDDFDRMEQGEITEMFGA